MKFKRKRVSVDDEKQILINMVTSTSFLKEIYHIAKKEYFVTPYAHYVLDWIYEYFENYNEAPKDHITDLYNVYKANLNSEELSLVTMFLQDLSDKYEENLNEKYYLDKALLYFRKRALEYSNEQIKSLLAIDKIDEAERVMADHKKIVKDTSGCVNPNDVEYIDKTFSNDSSGDLLFKFPGVLGEMLGWMRRGWLVVVQGVYKGSKSWLVDEFRKVGAFNARLKSVGFNFEMTNEQLAQRYWKGITATSDKNSEHYFPHFDCLLNQIDECELPYRINHIKLYDKNKSKPKNLSLHKEGYKPCDYCRNHPKLKHEYRKEMWFSKATRDILSPELVKKRAKALTRMYGDIMRIKCFPRGSATVADTEAVLDLLEYSEGFISDIVTYDYPQIMGTEPEAERGNDESRLNYTLLKLAGLASKRHCLVVAAAQMKTDTLKKVSTKMGDASGSSRAVYAHSTVNIGIMQSEEEKFYGARRVNCVAHRFEEFNPMNEVVILQDLGTGQVILDSDWVERE